MIPVTVERIGDRFAIAIGDQWFVADDEAPCDDRCDAAKYMNQYDAELDATHIRATWDLE